MGKKRRELSVFVTPENIRKKKINVPSAFQSSVHENSPFCQPDCHILKIYLVLLHCNQRWLCLDLQRKGHSSSTRVSRPFGRGRERKKRLATTVCFSATNVIYRMCLRMRLFGKKLPSYFMSPDFHVFLVSWVY